MTLRMEKEQHKSFGFYKSFDLIFQDYKLQHTPEENQRIQE